MKRKIIRQGHNTLTITLPRSWTKHLSINAGDEIDLKLVGSTLVLSADKLVSYGRKSHDISHLTSILPMLLLTFYRKGYDEVELTYEKPGTALVIQNILRDGSTGYHIIERSTKSCILKALSDVGDMDFNEILRKLFTLVKIKFEKIAEAMLKKDFCELQSILAMSGTPSRMTNFCYRLLLKNGIDDAPRTNHLQLLISNLENLDNQLNLLINLLLNPCLSVKSADLIALLNDIGKLYCDFYGSYYANDMNKLIPLITRKNMLSEKLQIVTDLDNNETGLFLNLNNSMLFMNEIINTALIMQL